MNAALISASVAMIAAVAAFSIGWQIGFRSGARTAQRLIAPDWMVIPDQMTKPGTTHEA